MFYSKRTSKTLSVSHPTRPRNTISQAYATATAIVREMSYPHTVYFPRLGCEWLSPPPLGRSLAILTYWAIITLFLTTGSVVHDAYYWERVGFRAAWISVTQVPLVYLLAGKVNVIGIFFASSYIDLNWIHRWVSRTLFLTVTIHGAFFITEWVRADFFKLELAMMPMVKYGIGLWAVLAWITISSLIPLRRLCYEFFVLQHLASGAIFLWLLYKHVPSYAAYNVWMAVAFVLSGRLLRSCIFAVRNLSRHLGYVAEVKVMPGDITMITIPDVDFSWTPGQHILLWCPTLGPLESHPFTISSVSQDSARSGSNKLELVVRARKGFTRRLHCRASSPRSPRSKVRAFVTGPFGNLPTWNASETIVLISASTGASFTLPILESILRDPCCVSRIDCLLLVRDKSHVEAYLQRLKAAAIHDKASEVDLRIEIAVTGHNVDCVDDVSIELGSVTDSQSSSGASSGASSAGLPESPLITYKTESGEHATSGPIATSAKPSAIVSPEFDSEKAEIAFSTVPRNLHSERNSRLRYSRGRPSLAKVVRARVEASAGETSVVVCGGKSLTSTVRNYVASLSDERAVHKGTGAQGIHLHVEEFGL